MSVIFVRGHNAIYASVHHDGELFSVTSDLGEFQVYFNYGESKAKVVVREYGRPTVAITFVDRTGLDFDRLGRIVWPLYAAATGDEWPDHPVM